MDTIHPRPALTSKQADVFLFLLEYFARNHQIPPTRAIQAHFGWASQTAAMSHLRRLQAKQRIAVNEAGKYKFVHPIDWNHSALTRGPGPSDA